MTNGKKRVLIIMESVGIGGTSTSLLNLLQVMRHSSEIDITVGLINMECKERLPDDTKVLDLSCFSRSYKNKWNKAIHILRTDFFAWLKIKCAVKAEQKNMTPNSDRISFVQRYELSEARKMRRVLDLRDEYDVVISWCEMFTDYLLADKIMARHKVAWIHPNYEQARFSRKYDAAMVANVERVVTVSRVGCAALARSFPEHSAKFRCVYNKLIAEDVLKKSREKVVEFDHRFLNLITVARIQNISKAYDRTLRVMTQLKKEGYAFRWHIIGDGENREDVQRLIREYGLEEEIKLLGAKSNPFPYVAAADLFLLCSYYEGFPMVIDEALSLGVPVMVTKYAAAEEQVEHGKNGIIVPNTERGIYEGLTQLFNNTKCIDEFKDFLNQRDASSYTRCDDFISLIMEICEK